MENREIKFEFLYRGMTKYHKKVYTLDQLCGNKLRDLCDIHDMMTLIVKRQFTDRFDQNGREIYYGDILKCNLWDDELNGTAVVKCDRGAPYLDFDHNEENFPEDFADKFHKFEIIGNIHLNPELLK